MEREDCISFQRPEKTKVNAKLYVETLLPELVQDCRPVLPSGDDLASSLNLTARLHTRQSWLKTGLLPTAVNSLVKMNGLRTRLTSILWTNMSEELYAWTLQVISTQAGEHRWAQESSAVDMGPAATGLDQQSHIDLSKKTLGLCQSWWWTLRTYAKVNYRPTSQILVFVMTVSVSWQWNLQLAVDYSVQKWNYGLEYLYSHNFGENLNFFFKFHNCSRMSPI